MIEYFNEDCVQGMKQYPDKYFDLAIVDPPYGINVQGGFGRRKRDNISYKYNPCVKWDSNIPSQEYFNELMRVSKNQIIWGG